MKEQGQENKSSSQQRIDSLTKEFVMSKGKFGESFTEVLSRVLNVEGKKRATLWFNKKDGFHTVKVFTDDYPQVKIGIPTDVILCNVLLDFLIAGGQYYYGFCDHCKRFYVSRRKQKKLFCGDICRANSHKIKAEKKKNKKL